MTDTAAPSDGNATQPLSGWRARAVVWSVVVAALGYLGFALWSGWRPLIDAVGQVGMVGVAIALALSMVNYGLRFVRWQAYLRALGHPVPWRPSLRIYLAGFALTTTPAKAGEALRGVLLKAWRVPHPVSLAAFISERLSDLLAIVLLTLTGLFAYPAMRPLIVVGAAAVFCIYLVLVNEHWLRSLRSKAADHVARHQHARSDGPAASRLRALGNGVAGACKLLQRATEVLIEARRCLAPGLFMGATALSVLAWAAEAWAFHLILRLLGFDVTPAFSVFVYSISILAGALTFVPGGLGGAEATMVALLIWSGAGAAESVAATMIIRLATLWFAVAIGCAVLAPQARLRGTTPAVTGPEP